MYSSGTRAIAVAALFATSCTWGGEVSPSVESGNVSIQIPGTTDADPALLLFSGTSQSTCVSFLPELVAPAGVTIPGVSNGTGCTSEVDAFRPGAGAFALSVDPTNPESDNWLNDAIASGSLVITMPGVLTVPLRIWLVAPSSSVAQAEAARNRLLDKAYPIYAMLGAGLTFDTLSSVFAPSEITPTCSSAGAISSNAAIYDKDRINVYFVAHYGGVQGLTPAYNCWQQSHPEIVFISYGNANLTDPTLAHELGHSLGLIHPLSLGGHTYAVPGFGPFNLMATNTDVIDITIGQLYAINFSKDSWINRAGSPILRPVVRVCQDSWGDGPCPALTLVKPGFPP